MMTIYWVIVKYIYFYYSNIIQHTLTYLEHEISIIWIFLVTVIGTRIDIINLQLICHKVFIRIEGSLLGLLFQPRTFHFLCSFSPHSHLHSMFKLKERSKSPVCGKKTDCACDLSAFWMHTPADPTHLCSGTVCCPTCNVPMPGERYSTRIKMIFTGLFTLKSNVYSHKNDGTLDGARR
jgi:hypothetical protein